MKGLTSEYILRVFYRVFGRYTSNIKAENLVGIGCGATIGTLLFRNRYQLNVIDAAHHRYSYDRFEVW